MVPFDALCEYKSTWKCPLQWIEAYQHRTTDSKVDLSSQFHVSDDVIFVISLVDHNIFRTFFLSYRFKHLSYLIQPAGHLQYNLYFFTTTQGPTLLLTFLQIEWIQSFTALTSASHHHTLLSMLTAALLILPLAVLCSHPIASPTR